MLMLTNFNKITGVSPERLNSINQRILGIIIVRSNFFLCNEIFFYQSKLILNL